MHRAAGAVSDSTRIETARPSIGATRHCRVQVNMADILIGKAFAIAYPDERRRQTRRETRAALRLPMPSQWPHS